MEHEEVYHVVTSTSMAYSDHQVQGEGLVAVAAAKYKPLLRTNMGM